MRSLFPSIEPYHKFRLKVSDLHELYIEEVGNPQGKPILFLHGGPGAGISEAHRRLFDPEFYRIILFDQRGAGKSSPHACLQENTTWHLVEDIETIRKHLQIEKWVVFGGSWGSTLGLAYAETHTERVLGLILRGIFLCRKAEINWFYEEGGCSWLFPELWKEYISPIPHNQRSEMLKTYYQILTGDDQPLKLKAAKAWSRWEASTIKLLPDPKVVHKMEADEAALAMARIECHYFMNNCFFRSDNQLLEDAHKLKNIPTILVHGRYDVICPVKNAFDLHAKMPHAKLQIIADAGHAFDEPGILNALINATNEFKDFY